MGPANKFSFRDLRSWLQTGKEVCLGLTGCHRQSADQLLLHGDWKNDLVEHNGPAYIL
jgi:hypothetical protein